jgi:hypothetical protein
VIFERYAAVVTTPASCRSQPASCSRCAIRACQRAGRRIDEGLCHLIGPRPERKQRGRVSTIAAQFDITTNCQFAFDKEEMLQRTADFDRTLRWRSAHAICKGNPDAKLPCAIP